MWFNKFVPINTSGLGGGTTNINPEQDNTEYVLPNVTYKGLPVYYQYFNAQKRISTSVAGIIGDIHTLLYTNLYLQGISGGRPSGVKWLLPYIHTNGTGVIMQLNGGSLQVQAQTSNFTGTYYVSGLIVYTKA